MVHINNLSIHQLLEKKKRCAVLLLELPGGKKCQFESGDPFFRFHNAHVAFRFITAPMYRKDM
jgi:hypothetical protein